MKHEPHDQHFKNLFLDFPKEALEGFLPQAIEDWRPIQQVEFMRPEPKKQRLSNRHLALDMPILFTFQQHQLLLWLSERALNQFHRFTSDVGGSLPAQP